MLKLLVSVILVSTILHIADCLSSTGPCPLSSQMTLCSPKCKDDTECFGQKCCPNICNTKSCTAANQVGSQSKYSGSSGSVGSSGGSGSYCGNVKCNSFQKCKMDPATRREKCV